MRNIIRLWVLGIAVVFLFASCSKPQQAIDEAQAALEAAKNEGADIYAAEELKALEDSMASAMDEVEAQSKKFFKSYGDARDSLAQLKADADALKASIPERKEKAKNDAIAMMEEAQAAVAEAKALLEKAPRGKGTRADIEAFTADLKGMEDSLVNVQEMIDSGDYLGALDSAKAIQEKAANISQEIQRAIEKVKTVF
jgi:chromosome segregation ATPase